MSTPMPADEAGFRRCLGCNSGLLYARSLCQSCYSRYHYARRRAPRSCANCGVAFEWKGPAQRYCSTLCRTRLIYGPPVRVCHRCERPFSPPTRGRKATYCGTTCRPTPRFAWRSERACVRCGSLFMPNAKRQVFCTTKCSERQRIAMAPERRGEKRSCLVCLGAFFYHPQYRVKFCGRACQARSRQIGAAVAVPWAKCPTCDEPYVRRRNRDHCRTQRYQYKNAGTPCVTCGQPLQRWRHKYCSAECRPRLLWKGRKRKKTLPLRQRRRVADRDQWRCQLCKRAVVPTPKPSNDDWSWTVDHILPESLGGGHDDANLRLAHRLCNSLRGAGGDVQLAFGIAA